MSTFIFYANTHHPTVFLRVQIIGLNFFAKCNNNTTVHLLPKNFCKNEFRYYKLGS